ncbi:MAG: twin-arginine translocation signal domain-containing protein, partial [Terriglobia bacterium]
MLIKKPSDIKSSEITDPTLYLNRRQFIQRAAAVLAAGVPGWDGALAAVPGKIQLPSIRKSAYSTNEPLNSFKDITGYINFYEFGTDKYSPVRLAKTLRTRPWTVRVSGE